MIITEEDKKEKEATRKLVNFALTLSPFQRIQLKKLVPGIERFFPSYGMTDACFTENKDCKIYYRLSDKSVDDILYYMGDALNDRIRKYISNWEYKCTEFAKGE